MEYLRKAEFHMKEGVAVWLSRTNGAHVKLTIHDAWVDLNEAGWEMDVTTSGGVREWSVSGCDTIPLPELGEGSFLRLSIPIKWHVSDGKFYPNFTAFVPTGVQVTFLDEGVPFHRG